MTSNDAGPRQPKNRARVDTTDEWELKYWAKELGLSPEALQQAVSEVGDAVEKLREYRPEERPAQGEGA